MYQNDIKIHEEKLTPINKGASGAYVYEIQEKYIVKYVCLSEQNSKICKTFRNEYNFYKNCSARNIGFVPEIIFQVSNKHEMLIVMKKYEPIKYCD